MNALLRLPLIAAMIISAFSTSVQASHHNFKNFSQHNTFNGDVFLPRPTYVPTPQRRVVPPSRPQARVQAPARQTSARQAQATSAPAATQVSTRAEPRDEARADARCDGVGKYANAVTRLRAQGIPRTNLSKMTTPEDDGSNFPRELIQNDVYTYITLTPDQHEKRVLALCQEFGIEHLGSKLKEIEDQRRSK